LSRGFDLDSQQSPAGVGNKIEVGAVPKRDQYGRADPGQPLDRRRLAQITLLPAIDEPLHSPNIRAGPDAGTASGPQSTLLVTELLQ
jgi:hypothetical protein